MRSLFVIPTLILLAACGDNEAQNDSTAMLPVDNEQAAMPAEAIVPPGLAAEAGNQAAAAAAAPTQGESDRFAGRWTGPEGLYAQITPGNEPGLYSVEMQYTLDSRGTFAATRSGDTLQITRNGQRVAIRPGTGAQTGMKWLDGKRDCLVVIEGSEGYCRD